MLITIGEFKEAISIIKFEIADEVKDAVNIALSTGLANIAFSHKEKDYAYVFKKSALTEDDLLHLGEDQTGCSFKLEMFFNETPVGNVFLAEKDSAELMSPKDFSFILDFIENQLTSFGLSRWLAENTKDPEEYDNIFYYVDATNAILEKVGYRVGLITDGISLNYSIVRSDPIEIITQVVISSKVGCVVTDEYITGIVKGTVEGLLGKLFSTPELDAFHFIFPDKAGAKGTQ